MTESKYVRNIELVRTAQGSDEFAADKATEELLGLNMGLVRSIALRFCDRGVEYEDLMQIGIMGMLKAVRSFDTERGTMFSTYAVPLISGEIKRHLRDEGSVKVSRYYKKLASDLMAVRVAIMKREGREPGMEELAASVGVSVEEAAVASDAMLPIASLSDGDADSGLTLEERLSDGEEEARDIFDKIALGEAIGKMPPLWRKIVLLRYYRDRTQQQTADSLGISQVKVSREEKKIMEFLRSELSS